MLKMRYADYSPSIVSRNTYSFCEKKEYFFSTDSDTKSDWLKGAHAYIVFCKFFCFADSMTRKLSAFFCKEATPRDNKSP